ncbi:TonB-dependent receptor [Sphingopyxis flava]|uniref:Iron complex outermembrane recepter protein n=1 Tax=Sphingopyxis flava TaxID=1507287 RepID=A0A1T4ZXA7_9SPHN|nr:TonB-dependent receptor [Sphingopyxis flava]SKB27358.1 iron complex outermembrane recepter protein [Sphingopyxis flava]
MKIKNIFLVSSALVYLVAHPAWGQEATINSPSADASDAVTSDDIVVTAQRRSARNKDVPIAVSVLSAKTLENSGINNTQDLVSAVPGLRMNQAGVAINPTLRGVTTNLVFLSEPNIATYIDNVYQASNFFGAADLPDVESIQVLKGPQGTLFGRNATGGAILVTTRDPEFTTSGKISMSYGNYNNVRASAFITAPLAGDVLAASISGSYEHRSPYMHNIYPAGKESNLDNVLVRAKLRFRPSQSVDFILTGLYVHKYTGDGQTYSNLNGNNAFKSLLTVGQPLAVNPREFSSEQDLFFEVNLHSVNLRGTVEAGPGEFKTITAYTESSSPTNYDSDNTAGAFIPVKIGTNTATFTQELLYTLTGLSRLNGTVGAFYYRNKIGYNPLDFGPFMAIRTKETTSSVGIFGELSYDLTDRLQVTGGLRYSWERKNASVGFGAPGLPVPDASVAPLGTKSWSAVTPRASILYKLTPTTNLFVTYSEGFKSGVFNTTQGQPNPVDPEKLRSIEGGVKISRPGLDVSLTGFYYDYKNIQISSFDGLNSYLQNAASARIYGADLTAIWRPIDNLSLAAGANYLNAKYKSYPNAAVFVPIPVSGAPSCAWQNQAPANIGNVPMSCDATGTNLGYAPDFSASLSASYVAKTDAGTFTLSANGYYSSKFYMEPLNRIKQPAYATLGARIAWNPKAEPNLQLAVYGQNLTSAKIFETLIVQASDTYRFQMPATYGVEVKYSF